MGGRWLESNAASNRANPGLRRAKIAIEATSTMPEPQRDLTATLLHMTLSPDRPG